MIGADFLHFALILAHHWRLLPWRPARSLPMFRADFLPFTSKIVEHSRYLPVSHGYLTFYILTCLWVNVTIPTGIIIACCSGSKSFPYGLHAKAFFTIQFVGVF